MLQLVENKQNRNFLSSLRSVHNFKRENERRCNWVVKNQLTMPSAFQIKHVKKYCLKNRNWFQVLYLIQSRWKNTGEYVNKGEHAGAEKERQS